MEKKLDRQTVPPELLPAYEQVNRGRILVRALRRKYELDDASCWVLLPTDSETLNRLATGEILLSFLEKRNCPNALILSPERGRKQEGHTLRVRERELLYLSIRDAEFDALLSYYRLVPFSQNLIVVSPDEPYSFSGWIGHFGITQEQFVRDGLFFGRSINWLWWLTDPEDIARAVDRNEGKMRGKRVYLYGWTHDAREIIRALESRGYALSGLLDSDPERERSLPGTALRIQLPEEGLLPYDAEATVVIVSKYAHEMRRRLAALGYGEEQTVEIPVSGGICAVKDDSRETMEREFKTVMEGVRLRREAGPQPMIVCQRGTGDVYYTCALLPGYLQARGIDRYTLALPDNPSCAEVARLFGGGELRMYSELELHALYKAWELLGGERMKLRPVLNLGSRLPRRFVPQTPDGKRPPWYHWLNCLRYQFFAAPGVRALTAPRQRPYREVAEDCLRKGLPEGRTVLLAPHVNAFSSVLARQTDFWPRLAGRLKALGYKVLTNCAGDEQAIPGTEPICVPYGELVPFLNYAGRLVAIRSGLCDVAAPAENCRMVLFYENGSGIGLEMWSLKKMGLHPNCAELLFTGDTQRLLEQTLEELKVEQS